MIIGFAGKKQSGKNTSANLIVGTILHSIGFATQVDGKTGELKILNDNGDLATLDLLSKNKKLIKWMEQEIFPFVKIYSFADSLKDICMSLFDLTYEQCYGTDEQKNSLTNLKWEDMPNIIIPRMAYNTFANYKNKDNVDLLTKNIENFDEKTWFGKPFAFNNTPLMNNIIHEPGFMTAREVLQYFGTNIIRKIYSDAWVKSTIKKIIDDNSMMAIVADVRFPNEVRAIQQNNGYVIRLTRFIEEDSHESENLLDNYKKFDYVIDNMNMSIQEQSVELSKIMEDIKNKNKIKE